MAVAFVPTADLCDDEGANGAQTFQTAALRDFGGKRKFAGKVATVRCYEDNSVVSSILDEKGNNRVLVIDGAGSCNRALFGDQLASKAIKNGWEGVIINGAIRDAAQLATFNIGVKALGTCPRKSNKRNTGERDIQLELFGAIVNPGDTVYADEDGVVVMASKTKAKL